MLLRPAFVKSLKIKDFVAKERFIVVTSIWFATDIVKTVHSDMCARIVANTLLWNLERQ